MISESMRQALTERVKFVIAKETRDLSLKQAKLYLSEMSEVAFREYNRLAEREWAALNEAEKMLCG